jgi:hypothetical protein
MVLIKDPKPDPSLAPFHDGLAELKREGAVVGHIATSVSTFWSPFSPLSRQWWVWSVIVWSNGKKEPALEDYPSWSYVADMKNGKFQWENTSFDVEWLPRSEARRLREKLNIKAEDF